MPCRARLQGLQGIDEIVEDVVKLLTQRRVLQDTYSRPDIPLTYLDRALLTPLVVIYTTDNGFHLGQHRVPGGKGLPYIEDVNLPFIVRGPGIHKAQSAILRKAMWILRRRCWTLRACRVRTGLHSSMAEVFSRVEGCC